MNTTDKSTRLNEGMGHQFADKADRLNNWLGLPRVVWDKWSARQPAVLAASLCLSLFIFSLDIRPQDLALILCVVLLVAVLSLAFGGRETDASPPAAS